MKPISLAGVTALGPLRLLAGERCSCWACRSETLVVFATNTTTVSAKVRAGSGQRASAQPRSAGLVDRARSALRFLTRRGCLNAANEVSVVSSATGPRDRASQGTLAQRGQAAARWTLPARAFARSDA